MKAKILIVDDDWATRELLQLKLSKDEFQIFAAATAEEFKTIAKNEKPDIILLDIVLGERQGTDVYDELLAEGFDPLVPVIFMSTLAQDQDMVLPQMGHRYALIPKPFDTEGLNCQIKALIKS